MWIFEKGYMKVSIFSKVFVIQTTTLLKIIEEPPQDFPEKWGIAI